MPPEVADWLYGEPGFLRRLLMPGARRLRQGWGMGTAYAAGGQAAGASGPGGLAAASAARGGVCAAPQQRFSWHS